MAKRGEYDSLVTIARPTGVTLLAMGVLMIAVFYFIRLAQAIAQWQVLAGIRDSLPLYLAANGAVWGIIALVLAWGLWQGRLWASRLTRWAALLFAAFYWVDRLFVQTGAGRSVNTLFVAVMTLVLVWSVFWILTRRKTRLFFGELHAHQPENTKIT